ncbi:YggS family pyridoxal phosphate-dependent enzyme [Nonomuraea sp. NPDC050310]|uniref:YggS family pyridoxal phosphate-dependent enzyme n=1 Tax=unclassified Nonomuraea TaxID=2593643 RepID=UPI0033F71237
MTSPTSSSDLSRREQIAHGLAEVEAQIADACRAAGRDRSEVALIAVTKTYPASDVRILASLGVRDVGENRDQEAAGKARECAGLPLTWHFVGQLQTNKVRSVASYADYVHSVDRSRLVTALSREAERAQRVIGCLLQIDLDENPGSAPRPGAARDEQARGGVRPADALDLAALVAGAEGLRLAGVMAVAPLGAEPGKAFARLAEVARAVRAEHPGATMVSAGMSGDLSEAVAHGATHVRVGTALLGRRKPFVR